MNNLVSNKLINSALYLTLGVGFGVAGLSMTGPKTYAEGAKCYGQYGNQIECPIVNKSFSVEKKVRKADSSDKFVETLTGIKTSNQVEFEIMVKNTGEIKIDSLNVIDVLPTNLDLVSADVNWVINGFEPGDVKYFYVIAKANDKEIAQNQEKCVTNVVNLVYHGHNEASDTAVVCISKPEVLGNITKLPETGTFGDNIGVSLIMIIAGALFLSVSALTKSYKSN